MKQFASIVIGNATTGNNQIHFRETTFLTESNRSHIEDCVRSFITLPIPIAFHDLVKMTCCPKEDIPKVLLADFQLNPTLIPDNAWTTFVNELRYQYKISNPRFMTEFTVPTECLATYEALASATSEVAAYMFYKKANAFLSDHIGSPIGQDHIANTFNQLTWHAKDPEVNQTHQLKGLRRLSLRDYEAIYFYNHLGKCISLFQNMFDFMKMDKHPFVMEPLENKVENDNDLPFFMEIPDTKVVTATAEKTYLELSKENILANETEFFNFVTCNDENSLTKLQNVGFDTEKIRLKAVAIFRIIRAHREMVEAIEALSK